MTPSAETDRLVDEVHRLVEEGMTRRAACREVGVSESTVRSRETREAKRRLGFPETHEPTGSLAYGEIPVVFRDYSDQETHCVYPLGDCHKGSPQHDVERWNEWLAYLAANPDCSMLGTGDFLNTALKTSVSDVYDETMTVREAKRELRRELEPIKNRIDVMIPGNHEARITKATGDCPIQDVTDYLEVPYARAAVLLVYRVGDIEYDVFVRHGSGGGQIGSRASSLMRQAQTLHADIYVSGHTHSQLVFPTEKFIRDGDRVVRHRQLFVSSGSFLRYEDYAAATGLTPTKIGAPRIRLDGTRKDAHVSV